jgi:uncharacterized membrane protein
MGRRAYFSDHLFDRVLAVVLTLALFGVQWYRFVTFRFTTYDLAVFENVVWKMAHGHGATTALTAWNTFADHLSPVLVLFVPLYWVLSHPVWFFIAQALGLGLAVLTIRPLARAVGIEKAMTGSLLVLAYAIQPGIWNAAINAFHPTTMAVPFLFIGCTAALRQQTKTMWLCFLVLIFLRDDLALVAIPIALVGWRAADSRARKSRLVLIGAAFAWTVIGSKIGEMMGASRHFVYRYGYLGDSMTDAAVHPIRTVVGLVQHLLTGPSLAFGLAMLVPLALLPLRRPLWLAMAVFVALPNLVAEDKFLHSPAFHYGAPIIPFLILATAGALVKWNEDTVRRVFMILLPLSAIAFLVVGPPLTGIQRSTRYKASDVRAAIKSIKPTDHVMAADVFGAYVAERDYLKPYPWPFLTRKPNFPLDPRVTDTSKASQDEIDVVIMPTTPNSWKIRRQMMASPALQNELEVEDFGTVTILRRVVQPSD